MPAIRILPDLVANQIAAGEVIERPVAVVKELLENSLDAGATRIEAEFRNGGKSLIRVEDNGSGMAPDDVLLAVERHATSKIRRAPDLEEISTFGFRGEALPSIASVARFTLRSRIESREHGTEILINGGKFVCLREYGMPSGTVVEVANLFNSVPARRKFLKTENTEAAHIVHMCRLYAVAHPEASFSLVENGRTIFRSPACRELKDRIGETMGWQIASELVEMEAESDSMKLSGLIGRPGVGRATRQEMVTYVNRRPVDSRTLNYALIEAYHSYIPKGRYPMAFLFLDVDPREVDVNVHPSKREVRFRMEGWVRQFVISAVLNRLRSIRGFEDASQGRALEVARPGLDAGSSLATVRISDAGVRRGSVAPTTVPDASPSTAGEVSPLPSGDRVSPAHAASTMVPSPEPKEERFSWRYLGAVGDSYVLFDSGSGLVLVHLQRAVARIIFEDIQVRLKAGRPVGQKLLFPVPLELDALSSSSLDKNLAFFRENGFEIEPFGRNFYRVTEVPDWVQPEVTENLVRDVIALIRERGIHPDREEIASEEVARLAAARSTRVQTRSSPEEMETLLQQLFRCRNPLADPGGRPAMIEISNAELEKRFGK